MISTSQGYCASYRRSNGKVLQNAAWHKQYVRDYYEDSLCYRLFEQRGHSHNSQKGGEPHLPESTCIHLPGPFPGKSPETQTPPCPYTKKTCGQNTKKSQIPSNAFYDREKKRGRYPSCTLAPVIPLHSSRVLSPTLPIRGQRPGWFLQRS